MFRLLVSILRPLKRLLIHEKPVAMVLRERLDGKSVFFIQIGSNDGLQGDPLNELVRSNLEWRGIFVEPVPFLFKRLCLTYSCNSSRLAFENVAIADDSSDKTFYYVSDRAKEALGEQLPFWYDQLGSFNRQHILSHLNGILEPYIVEENVRCSTLADLLERHQVSHLNLLHIDAEGYDYKILRQLDFSKYHPDVVLFEFKHLTEDEKRDARVMLRSEGYSLNFLDNDCLAYPYPMVSLLRKMGIWSYIAPIAKFVAQRML